MRGEPGVEVVIIIRWTFLHAESDMVRLREVGCCRGGVLGGISKDLRWLRGSDWFVDHFPTGKTANDMIPSAQFPFSTK